MSEASGKAISIVLIAVTLAVIGLLIGIQATGIGAPNARMADSDSYSYERGERVSVYVSTADVQCYPSADGTLRVDIPSDGDFSVREEGGSLSIQQRDQPFGFNWFGGQPMQILLYVPSSGIEAMELFSASGDISIEDVAVGALKAGSTSGRVEVQRVHSDGAMALSSVSGNVSAQDCSALELALSSTSGRVEAQKADAARIDANTVSGRIELSATERCDKIAASTASGSIDLAFADPVSGDISSISGRVNLQVDREQTVRYSTLSGGVYLDGERIGGNRDDRVVQRGEHSIRVETTSGSIYID